MTYPAYTIVIFSILVLSCVGMWALMGLWVYNDAKARGIENSAIWTAIAIIVPNFIGLVIYLVVRDSKWKELPAEEASLYKVKERKYMRRFIQSLIVVMIVFAVCLASFIGVSLSDSNRLSNRNSYSFRTYTPKYTFANLRLSTKDDVIDFQFGKFSGSYKLGTFRVRDGDAPTLHIETMNDDIDEQPVYFELQGKDITYLLEEGANNFQIENGRWSIVAYGDNAENGHYILRVK